MKKYKYNKYTIGIIQIEILQKWRFFFVIYFKSFYIEWERNYKVTLTSFYPFYHFSPGLRDYKQ